MFNFSLKNLYDDKLGHYLFLLDLFKWGAITLIILGAFLAFWFNDYWLAIIGGILLSIISFTLTIIVHFIRKKLAVIIAKGGNLVEETENYLKEQAKQKTKEFIAQRRNGNKST